MLFLRQNNCWQKWPNKWKNKHLHFIRKYFRIRKYQWNSVLLKFLLIDNIRQSSASIFRDQTIELKYEYWQNTEVVEKAKLAGCKKYKLLQLQKQSRYMRIALHLVNYAIQCIFTIAWLECFWLKLATSIVGSRNENLFSVCSHPMTGNYFLKKTIWNFDPFYLKRPLGTRVI